MADEKPHCPGLEALPTQIASGHRGLVPGDEESLRSMALGQGAKVIQDTKPLKSICRHICGYHVYAHDITRQVEAHHYCSHLSEDMMQCVIYDSPEANARLIGVEYIISAKIYRNLPPEEKIYWHSHEFEVKGGIITLPVSSLVPRAVHAEIEHLELSQVINTYGKTWHLWQVDRGDVIPYGPPQLMMALTEEGQIDPKLLEARDKREGVDTNGLRNRRAVIHPSMPLEAADQLEARREGMAWQATMAKVPFKNATDGSSATS
ncbi:hypothetical protein BC832DRAFT_544355 [Gaertneriomyces semiglobifer]|nr:hypothetical protein BC832DRAFT_544355 [Gaertneriomyces semiglobifer]